MSVPELSSPKVLRAGSMARKQRPRTIQLDPQALADGWDALASLRDCGFQWDGTEYPNEVRGRSPCKASLLQHKEALSVLLKQAPTGFPSHSRLRLALQILHGRHRIWGDATDTFRMSVDAADRWRIMAKDVYCLAKQHCTDAQLSPLVRLVDISGNSGVATPITTTDDVAGMFPSLDDLVDRDSVSSMSGDDDEGDVTIIKMVCCCAECRNSMAPVPISEDEAEKPMRIADATRGGQRRQSQPTKKRGPKKPKKKPVRRALRQKTPASQTAFGQGPLRSMRSIEHPVRMAVRQKSGEVLIQDAGQNYIVGMFPNRDRMYKQHIETVYDRIQKKEVLTIGDARAALAELRRD